jgi:uncharacterized protein (TIGR03067 family)
MNEEAVMRVLLAALLSAGLAAGVSWGDDKVPDAKKFDGTWQGVSVTNDGKEMPKEEAEKLTLTVKGDRYTLKGGPEAIEGTHKLDPSKSPRTIDATRTAGPDKGKTILGIYELTDDTYKVCFAPPGKDRPTEFSARAGSGNRLIVMKRQKP